MLSKAIGSVVAFIRSVPPALAALAFGLGALTAWAYWPALVGMWQKWDHDPQYSHGYLVPLFAAVLLGLRHERLKDVTFRPNAWGIPLLVIGALLRIGASSRLLYIDWLEAASLLPTLAGLFVLLGGGPALRWAWPSILFLLFMIPLPFGVENLLSGPLRRLATLGSNYLLQTFGFAAVAEGNTIYLDNGPLLVHEACSGLSMLLIFFALSTAVVIVVKRPWLDRGVILLSTVPIAVIANVIRITATGMAQEYVGVKQARTFFHDWAGFLMMPLALAMLWAELWLLAHLLPEEAEAKISPLGLPLSRTAPAAKKKTGPKSPLRLGSEQ